MLAALRDSSLGNLLGCIARDHIDQRDQIESVLPVNGQKRGGLIVEKQILAKHRPKRRRFCRGRLLRIAGVITERLDIAGRFSLDGQSALERSPRRHAAVLINRVNEFAQAQRRCSGQPRPKMIMRDRNRSIESLEARRIGTAIGGHTSDAIGQRIAKAQIVQRGVVEILHAHTNFALRSQKTENRLGILFRLAGFRREPEPRERKQE